MQAAKQLIVDLQAQLDMSRVEADQLRKQQQRQQQERQQQEQHQQHGQQPACDIAASADDHQRQDGRGARALTPAAGAGSVPKMQERLTRLRKEQADAEAAREAAWAELKAVVCDISSLASVDNLQSVGGLVVGFCAEW
ncbi:hypothetical protein MNEG_2220 [Monoraphidium neglectum]|jgi:hypothetical protein|uniref:Uncharacterized protein n=1 Tax=Monoraphidium neglectum TaxID=145388 RepID=A0A0D2MZM0_9CHLO|nr:hypothetical protein MNEG_2220 [Monoraphidium neglectum]KIZ05732.1 hypothetical protein MNEG_2220 [Monoraphidium neglectum]|eukprot:XP_013904751.1 hypothetical protein MNEG_2220 [Monoraphidium neglectum]